MSGEQNSQVLEAQTYNANITIKEEFIVDEMLEENQMTTLHEDAENILTANPFNFVLSQPTETSTYNVHNSKANLERKDMQTNAYGFQLSLPSGTSTYNVHNSKANLCGKDRQTNACGLQLSLPTGTSTYNVHNSKASLERKDAQTNAYGFQLSLPSESLYYNANNSNTILEKTAKDYNFHNEILNTYVKEEFFCSNCQNNFPMEKELLEHICTNTAHPSNELHSVKDNEKVFFCILCSATLNSQHDFEIHMQWHSEETAFKCKICAKSFYSSQRLKEHAQKHKAERRYKCKDCNRTYGLEESLRAHRKLNHRNVINRKNSRMESAIQSSKRFKRFLIEDYKNNQKSLLEKFAEVFLCDQCDNKFLTKKEQQDHVCKKDTSFNENTNELQVTQSVKIKDKPFYCPICNMNLAAKRNLQNHMLRHTGNKPFKCEFCSRAFCTAPEMKNHVAIHSGERNYKCQDCNKAYGTLASFTFHRKRHHPFSKNYQCYQCGESFVSLSRLERHMTNVHKVIFNHECPECKKSFKSRNGLVLHSKIHKFNLECKECKKPFENIAALELHKKIHQPNIKANDSDSEHNSESSKSNTSLKKRCFKCSVCPSRFCTPSQLKEHMVIHTGERKFKCEHCGKAFGTSSGRHQHRKRYHALIKNHTCQQCYAAFDLPSELLKHMARVHEIRQCFPCTFCTRTFTVSSGLKNHLKTHEKRRALLAAQNAPIVGENGIDSKQHIALNAESFLTDLDEKWHKCSYCPRSFYKNCHLRDHMVVHTRERKFKCEHCNLAFGTKTSQAKHQKRAHSLIKNYPCQECEEAFYNAYQLKRHMKMIHNFVENPKAKKAAAIVTSATDTNGFREVNVDISTPVTIKEEVIDTYSEGNQILPTYYLSERQNYLEKSTYESFINYDNPEQLASHHIEIQSKQFYCGYCNNNFQFAEQLMEHNCQSSELLMKNDDIKVETEHNDILNSNEIAEVPKKTYDCGYCDQKFATTCGRAKHWKRVHPLEKNLPCNLCGEIFFTSRQLQRHITSNHK